MAVMDSATRFMQQALELARKAVGLSEPNPRVGCVIVSASGDQVLGQGHTQAAGKRPLGNPRLLLQRLEELQIAAGFNVHGAENRR